MSFDHGLLEGGRHLENTLETIVLNFDENRKLQE